MCYAWIAPVALLAAPFGGWLADSPHAGYRACFALAIGWDLMQMMIFVLYPCRR